MLDLERFRKNLLSKSESYESQRIIGVGKFINKFEHSKNLNSGTCRKSTI